MARHLSRGSRFRALAVASLALVVTTGGLTACSDDGPTVTVYSGRSEELIKPLLDRFTDETGIAVTFKQADSADMALLIDQEGDASPADVFISQNPGAMAFLGDKGRLAPLSQASLDRVSADNRSVDGTWVGLSGRVRTLVYNPDLVDPADLPTKVVDVAGDEFAGKVALAPSNGSFQDFVSGLRTEIGDDATEQWLADMVAGGAPTYANNVAIIDAVARGEVPMGLVNHYYLEKRKVEEPGVKAVTYFFPDGDPGSMLLLANTGIIDSAPHPTEAQQLVDFLLSDASQQYFADETFEYPLVPNVPPSGDLPPLDSLDTDRIDFSVLGADFETTLAMIRDSGLAE